MASSGNIKQITLPNGNTYDINAVTVNGHTVETDVPSGAVFTDTTYTAATANPKMDGTVAVGTSTKYAREDHVHPSDTSRVPTTRKVNNKTLSADITLAASDVGAIATSAKGAASGVAELDANGKVPSSQLPSFVDDVLEYNGTSSFPSTGEAGKIYVDTSTNKTYRWGGSSYTEISASLALGETSSTAYRGDRGKTAYTHATDSSRLTTATSSGLYKVAATAQGHIASLTAVTKDDITGLGIPGSDTNTKYGLSISGHTVSLVEGGTTASVTVPDNNDNNAVTQTATTTSADYEVLFSATADNTTRTEGARKNSNMKFNPSTGNLQVTQINGVTVGSSPKFTDNNTTYGLSISGHTVSLVAGGTTSSVTVPDNNTTYSAGTGLNLTDTTFRNVGAEYIRGTWTAATNAWTGVTTDPELYDGKEILLYLPFAGNSSATTLNLTLSGGGTTGAKAVYFNSTTRHTTHYGQHQMVRMTYHQSHTIAGTAYEGWWIDYARDTNDSAHNVYEYYAYYAPTTALYRYIICIQSSETTIVPMNAVNNTTATTKTLTTESFNPFGLIAFYNNTNTVNANTVVPAGRLYVQANVDLRYSFNTGTTLTANKAVYLVCSPQSDGKAKLHSTPITQTLPTTDDGFYYIYLGVASNNQSLYFNYFHPVFMYKNGAVREISQYAPYAGDAATVNGKTVAVNVPSNAKFTDTTYSAGTGLKLSGTTFSNNVPRVAKDSKTLPGKNTWVLEEFNSGTDYNLPSNHWYYIFSMQGTDTGYGAQLALGMTTAGAYYRVYKSATWSDWQSIINTDTNTKYGLSISGHTVSLVEGGTTASVTVPDNNDNNAVTQTATTTSADYEVLFSSTADNTTRTEGARKNSNLKFNPSTGNLQVTKINGVDVGSSPKFTDNNTTYTANTTSIGSASGWSTGTPASASVANGVLTITNGTKPALTVTSTTVATGITAS